jgi:hypothetical protein
MWQGEKDDIVTGQDLGGVFFEDHVCELWYVRVQCRNFLTNHAAGSHSF